MRERTIEILVGLFLIAGLASLTFLGLKVSGLSLSAAQNTYTIYADFNDVGGLQDRAQVSIGGVTIGRVSDITLDKKTYQAKVAMEIYQSVDNIPKDSAAVIRTAGLLGEKYVDVSIGADSKFMKNGDYFYSTQSALNIEKLISNFAAGSK